MLNGRRSAQPPWYSPMQTEHSMGEHLLNGQASPSGAELAVAPIWGEVFEIFQRELKDPMPRHGGNLCAPDSELAIHYAKEFYSRRQESLELWIIPRSCIWEVTDTTCTHLPLHALSDIHTAPGEPYQLFAVFGQKEPGKHLRWLEDVEAVSQLAAAEAALQVAHAVEGGCLRLWLCPRSAIIEVTDPDLLQLPLDRSYRRLDGYNIREKLRIARQRVQQAQGEEV